MNRDQPVRASIEKKVRSLDQAVELVKLWREQDECAQITFTNGVFDLVHYGHLNYLAKSADLGTKFIVGVNSDDSVRRLKGPERPIFKQKTRLFKLACLAFVDLVVLFESDTPYELIKAIQPDVLVKGGDYREDQIVGADIVEYRGGLVMTMPLDEGYSSTNVIKKIRDES